MIWGVLVVLLVAVSFAYAAANTVDVTGAGDGAETISGYEVTNVHYVLNVSDPGTIDSVEFTLSPLVTGASDPSTVKVKLGDSAGAWYTCTFATTWSCTIGDVDVLDAVELRVVAAQ